MADELLDEKTYETRSVTYASFGLRTAGGLLDGLLLLILTYGLFYQFKLATSYSSFLGKYYLEIISGMAVYFIYFDGSESNATPGKQIMGIRMLNEQQQDISMGDSFRHFLLSVVLFFGYFLQLFTPRRQTLADKICKVIVVKRS